jgi:hypothetical protein
LRARAGDRVGAEAALRAAAVVFTRIGERQGLAAVGNAALIAR